MQVPPITSHISAPNAEGIKRRIRVDETSLDTERLPERQTPYNRRRRKDRRKQNRPTSFQERRKQRDRRSANQNQQTLTQQKQALAAYPSSPFPPSPSSQERAYEDQALNNANETHNEGHNDKHDVDQIGQNAEQVDAVLEPSHLGQNIDTCV